MQTDTRTARERDEAARVVAWRCRRLLDAGFGPLLAEVLAREPRVDLHAVLQLVERGCPPELAARILSPSEHEGVRR